MRRAAHLKLTLHQPQPTRATMSTTGTPRAPKSNTMASIHSAQLGELGECIPNKTPQKGDTFEVTIRCPRNHSLDELHYGFNVIIFPNSKQNQDGLVKCDINNVQVTRMVKLTRAIDDNIERSVSECIICFERLSACVYSPCGHMNCCFECGATTYLQRGKCPICNEFVQNVVRVHHLNKYNEDTKQG